MNEGLAHVCLITSSMTIVRARIESSIPRKRKGSATLHEKVDWQLFCLIAGCQQVLWSSAKCHEKTFQLWSDQMCHFGITRICERTILRVDDAGGTTHRWQVSVGKQAQVSVDSFQFGSQVSLLSICHTRHALKEVLANPQVTSKLMDTKASAEVKVLNDFYEMMKTDPNRAFYGLKHVMYANDRLSIQTLLISDHLFR